MFIPIGLHEACFVSAVTAGVTGAHLAQNGEIRKNRVDSIRVTESRVELPGSADSEGFSRWRRARIALWFKRIDLAANMGKRNTDVIACQ